MTNEYREALSGLLNLTHAGKVRETYELPGYPDLLLQYVTDRVSTHNVVHKSIVPQKGIVLTALTIYWLREVFPDLPHHLVASGREIYRYLPEGAQDEFPELHYRVLVVRKLQMSEVELIYRRYFVKAGSLYSRYMAGEDPYGLQLPEGLSVMHRFDPLIFTPTDKSETDDPLPALQVLEGFSREVRVTTAAFMHGEAYLREKGIALLDSKFEAAGGVLADELLTPDSSRFADLDKIKLGEDPPWLDKEFVRDEAVKLWTGGPKVPLEFSQAVIEGTEDRYDNILYRITGHNIQGWVIGEHFDFCAS